LAITHFSSMFILFISMIIFIHYNSGGRGIHYGATLKNQINLIKKLNNYSKQSPIIINVENMNRFKHRLILLMSIYVKESDSDNTKTLVLQYNDSQSPYSGKVILKERNKN
jgi:hypothetical protein